MSKNTNEKIRIKVFCPNCEELLREYDVLISGNTDYKAEPTCNNCHTSYKAHIKGLRCRLTKK